MIHTDESFAERVAARVAEIEGRTDAEIVVVAAARSADYRDVSARGAAAVTLVAAAVLLAIPWTIGPVWFVLDLLLVGLVAERLLRARPLLRRLTRSARRREEARRAATVEFVREAVHGTPHRTGVLVYVSALEGVVEVLPDLGVEGRVPRGELRGIAEAFAHDDLTGFLAGLDRLGEVLALRVPHRPDSDAVDLPDAPRIRP